MTDQKTIPSRNIILCFDGTGNKFGEASFIFMYMFYFAHYRPFLIGGSSKHLIPLLAPLTFAQNSNVVRFFRALIKDKPNQQIVYYQVQCFQTIHAPQRVIEFP